MEYRLRIRTLLLFLLLFTLVSGSIIAGGHTAKANTQPLHTLPARTIHQPSSAQPAQLAMAMAGTTLPFGHTHHQSSIVTDEAPAELGWDRWLAMVINITAGILVFMGLYFIVSRLRAPLRNLRKR